MAVPWLRGDCALSPTALHGARQRQESGKEAQVMAQICCGSACWKGGRAAAEAG